ncbi:MAG: ATP-binding protein [Candidatus Omnitrophica bacterium]|nr:ATP-binding protein [Candidatus Omnitrophota bacterium]
MNLIIIAAGFLLLAGIIWRRCTAKVTETKRALDKSEEKYRELVQGANSIILRMDVKGNVTFFNEFAQKFFGYKEAEILGQNVIGTIVPLTDTSGHDLRMMIDDIMVHPERYVNNENENMNRNGKRVWIAWTNKAILDKGNSVREVLCIGNNITALKQAETEIVKAKEAAESASRAKSSFLANMSHELRTPLNAIIGFSELMKDGTAGPMSDEQKEYAGHIWESGKYLLSLINDILDLSKVEAGKMVLELSEFDLRELLKKSLVFISERARQHGIKLSSDIKDDVCMVRADERKVKQIIFNLLSNAVKFTPDGGKIGIEAGKTDGGGILISVWDTGIGIEVKDDARVFAEFEQIDNEYSRKYAGTGLGMPLSKKFVELHGGKIWFESEGKNKGTRFYFTLPVNAGQ